MTPDLQTLIARIESLEAQFRDLAARFDHRSTFTNKIRELVGKWPGPFTSTQIREALYQLHPEAKPGNESGRVNTYLHTLARSGHLVIIEPGLGRRPSVFERAPKWGTPPALKRKGYINPGASGLSSLIRAVLPTLGHFRMADLKKAVLSRSQAENPDCPITVPKSSWHIIVSQLVKRGEIVAIEKRRGPIGTVYAAGSVVISPNGEELTDVQAAWEEFKRSNEVRPPAALTADTES